MAKEQAMNTDQRAVWERYVASWKTASATEKQALFESCVSPECLYTDPVAQARGWDELMAHMAAFHAQLPGAHFVTEYFLAHHGRSIARWKMLDAAQLEIGEGISYAEYDEQHRLAVMTGFFEAARS
ncbi:MAG: nuclear transport factor 2 family protein [Polyangiaceae bacterium]